MCGIAGILRTDGATANDDAVALMISVLRHRGPDESGVLCDQAVALGHARLSIIDLSGGKQPMSSSDGSLRITFNGEIFNYIELRKDLQKRGHVFKTESDTEVLLHLYEEKGTDCVRFLNGQWAFAIWDHRNRRLFLSRDRAGIRPLFYVRTQKAFIFASEIKALFTNPEVGREIDLAALDQIFTYWVTLAPRTVFKGVYELPPASCLVVEDRDVRTWKYWDFSYDHVEVGDEKRCAEQLLDLLVDATRIRLRSDVPVGAYLSGGLDSTLTSALVRRFTNTQLKTFSVSFDDSELDESQYQQCAVKFIGSDHHQVRCSYQDICRSFPDAVWHAEKPLLRTAPVPFFLLSGLVRNIGFKVVLTGEGADEVLGGYDIFKEAKIRCFWAAQPTSHLRPQLLRRLYPYMPAIQRQPDAYLRSFFRIRANDAINPYFSHTPRWELTSTLRLFYSDDLLSQLETTDKWSELERIRPDNYASWDPFCRAQWLESALLLPGYILSSQGDRVSMAHSVEGRYPFLDYRIVEFCGGLPPHMKMKVLNEKYLLKLCADGLVPDEIRTRPKQPYRAPDALSFIDPRTSAFRETYVQDSLTTESIERAGLFEPKAVQRLVSKFLSGRAIGVRDNMAFVGILSTQLVFRQFIDNCSPWRTNAVSA